MISCVIPTKNRASLLQCLLDSLCSQKLDGMEIVVIDNDDGGDTERCVRSFGSMVRHVRTGGLSMIENWNRALSEGRKEYSLLIEDKMRVRAGALELVAERLQRTRAPLMTWRTATDRQAEQSGEVLPIESTTILSLEVLRYALKGNWKAFNRQAPKGLNCAISAGLLGKVRSSLGRPPCRAACPDYTLAFTLLQQCSEIEHLDSILYQFGESAPSQGRDALIKKDSSETVAKNLGCSERDFWSMVPVKYLSINNVIYNDMLNCLNEVEKGQEKFVCWGSYYLELIDELRLMNSGGVDIARERKLLYRAFRENAASFKLLLLKRILHELSWQMKSPGMRPEALSRFMFRVDCVMKGAL